ncbi:Myotubularin-related protein 3 [Amphibalanus amphitrite]|uniref:Lateral signaling target protein 2 homolog n=1 Tax=Amphibalanus amphitrite TaxID=1232801 RepID=A0A6A4W1P4_AMPAM|nr:Myotubularin-related protein 3 [Amphibalanus amphitrite]
MIRLNRSHSKRAPSPAAFSGGPGAAEPGGPAAARACHQQYPKRDCVLDAESAEAAALLPAPFRLLHGEYVVRAGRVVEGRLYLTNYRLYLQADTASGLLNVPLGLLETAETRDICYLHVQCKDARAFRLTLPTGEACAEWQRDLAAGLAPPERLSASFSHAFHAWCREEGADELHQTLTAAAVRPAGAELATYKAELERMGFDLRAAWRISTANQEFKLCPSYPRFLLVPLSISDDMLEKVARFRALRRVPAVCWRHGRTGAVLVRSGQPEVGWLGWRSAEDEELIKAVSEACAANRLSAEAGPAAANGHVNGDVPSLRDLSEEALLFKNTEKVVIVDARSYAAAVANRARGGGVECNEYYPNSEVVFMNLPNIHTVRKAFQALRALLSAPTDQTNWFQSLEATRWLSHMSALLRAAVSVARYMDDQGRPVLVHCSDGWDRTPQITALAQLLLDPHCRTIDGFQALLEREWLDFGHKFADRCGNAVCTEDANERCPVFLQWLDCVYQLTQQFPCDFQFNMAYLVKLVHHAYSGLFGTFLGNSARDREAAQLSSSTYSVFAYLRANRDRFTNYLYNNRGKVLTPSVHPRDLCLWSAVYLGSVPPCPDEAIPRPAPPDEPSEPAAADTAKQLVRTRSCEDLTERKELTRTASDPSLLDTPSRRRTGTAAGRPDAASAVTLAEDADSGVPAESPEGSEAAGDTSSCGGGVTGSTDTLAAERRERSTSTSDISHSGVRQRCVCHQLRPASGAPRRRQPRPQPHAQLRLPRHAQRRQKFAVLGLGLVRSLVRRPSHRVGWVGSVLSERTADSASGRRLEMDGLPRVKDDLHQRLYHMHMAHKMEVEALRRDLHMTRLALCSQVSFQCSSAGRHADRPDEADLTAALEEQLSVGRQSSTSDGGSWEAVEEADARPQLWVPDYAAQRCTGCDTEFWLGRRRHHCRNCGNVYCADCSKYEAVIPREQLYTPVRVCSRCFASLSAARCSPDPVCGPCRRAEGGADTGQPPRPESGAPSG